MFMIYYNISSFILANQSNTGQQNDVVGYDRLFTEVRIVHTIHVQGCIRGSDVQDCHQTLILIEP